MTDFYRFIWLFWTQKNHAFVLVSLKFFKTNFSPCVKLVALICEIIQRRFFFFPPTWTFFSKGRICNLIFTDEPALSCSLSQTHTYTHTLCFIYILVMNNTCNTAVCVPILKETRFACRLNIYSGTYLMLWRCLCVMGSRLLSSLL